MAQLDKIPKKGKVYKYPQINLIFWAQGGCVCFEDTLDGSFQVLKRADFVARILLVRDCLAADTYRFADERNAATNFVIDGCECNKEAKHQGDPFDPRVLEEKRRERENSKGYMSMAGAVMLGGLTGDVKSILWNGPQPEKKFSPGPGQQVTLRTRSQDDAPELAKFLPPLPRGREQCN